MPIHEHMPDLPWEVANVVNKATSLDPTKRYQSPTEMMGDLIGLGEQKAAVNGKSRVAASVAAKARSVMIVESNTQIQDALRQHFKDAGFRVLVTADAQRPSSLFTETE